MSLRHGDVVTTSFLLAYFRRVIVHLNNVKNIRSITSGQILDTTNTWPETVLNQFSDQFFDNQKNYLSKYYSDLTELEG